MKKILSFIFLIFIIGCYNDSNIGTIINESQSLITSTSSIQSSLIPDNDTRHFKRYLGDGPLICFMGDSRVDLYDVGNSFLGKNMINYGRVGSTTFGIVRRVHTVIMWNPDIIIISTGYNNIYQLNLYPDPVGNIIWSCQTIQAANPSAIIYVTNIVPETSEIDLIYNRNIIISTINSQLESACNSNGINYLYLDILEDGSGNLRSDYSIDGVHYNSAGYDALTLFYKSNIPELN